MSDKVEALVKPSKRFERLSERINGLAKMLGVDLLAPILQYNYRTYLTFGAIANYTAFTIFSVVKLIASDWSQSLRACAMLGGLFQGLGKLITCLVRQPKMRRVILYTIRIYALYEQRGDIYRRSLENSTDRMLHIKGLIRNGYILTYTSIGVLPLIFLLYNGRRFTLMYYTIPGLDIEDNVNYIITYLIQLGPLVVAGFGLFAGDLLVLIALAQIFTFADILQIKADNLNKELEKKAEDRRMCGFGEIVDHPGDTANDLLMDLIQWHQAFTEYTIFVADLYWELITVQVLSSAVSLTITFCIMLIQFHPLFGIYSVLSAYSMFVYCFLGTKIQYTHEQICDDIWNVAWYELSGRQRRLYAMMLKKSQQPNTIKLLGFMPLSVSTALQITKLIYSLSMMMMQHRT